MEGLELSSGVTRQAAEDAGDPNSPVRIALLDLGNKAKHHTLPDRAGGICAAVPHVNWLGRNAGMGPNRLDDF